ncbi:MAG: hypothetical protein QME68_01730 [Elusimicrobiota bacterium]|nr:hypothetical protein [Elusimicrobiota bacterium]
MALFIKRVKIKIYFRKLATPLLVWFLFISYAFSQISINSSVDKKEIAIGDSIIYTLTIKCPKEYKFAIPDFKNILQNFEIRNQEVKTKKNLKIYEFELTSYTTGEQKINSFEIEFVGPGTERKVIQQKEIPIVVKFAFTDIENAKDIRDIKPQLLPPRSVLYYILPFLTTAAGIYILSRKQKKIILQSQKSASPQEILSPEEVAYRNLEKLNSSDLISQGKIKEYYVELSEIIRRYLAAKYKVPVIERTTDELYADLKKILDVKYNIKIKEFLEVCDLVKFAKYIPKIQEIQQDFNRAKELIKESHVSGC